MVGRAAYFLLLLIIFNLVSSSSNSQITCHDDDSEHEDTTGGGGTCVTKENETCYLVLRYVSTRAHKTSFSSGCMRSFSSANSRTRGDDEDTGVRLIVMQQGGLSFYLYGQCNGEKCNDFHQHDASHHRLVENLQADYDRAMKKCGNTTRKIGDNPTGTKELTCHRNQPRVGCHDRRKCADTCHVSGGNAWCVKFGKFAGCYDMATKRQDSISAFVSEEVNRRRPTGGNNNTVPEDSNAWEIFDPHRRPYNESRLVVCRYADRCNLDRRPVRNVAQAICQYWVPREPKEAKMCCSAFASIWISSTVTGFVVIVALLIIAKCKIVLIVSGGEDEKGMWWRRRTRMATDASCESTIATAVSERNRADFDW